MCKVIYIIGFQKFRIRFASVAMLEVVLFFFFVKSHFKYKIETNS
jgi:hypothetical protein